MPETTIDWDKLQQRVDAIDNVDKPYVASDDIVKSQMLHECIPEQGCSARHVAERILQYSELDNRPRLNTSSYVNVVREPEEETVALLGMSTNLADGSVYPASVQLHDTTVNMIAQLWNCPAPEGEDENYSGAGTVGSTEACLLAGLALKFRWREWYKAKYGLKTQEEMLGVVPNIVISTCYQAAWEKFFRYFDVAPRFLTPNLVDNKMSIDPTKIKDLCDEKTIAVVGILGNHYNGAYDPVWEMDKVITEFNEANGYQIGLHIDAASGGFIAPFQENMPPFDFRLKNVLSISASGHKFGESVCGTGWLVFRHRHDLAEHIAVSVTYLGGKSDSMTLNFSRPATAAYVQLYKLLRLGMSGYRKKVTQQMQVTKYLRDQLKEMKTDDGRPRFQILDGGDEHCLPVLGARLNPDLGLAYNDIDLQHALAESHWYVSGYSLSFEDYSQGGKLIPLCTDTTTDMTMFRVVVKANLALYLAQDLSKNIGKTVGLLDQMNGKFKSMKQGKRDLEHGEDSHKGAHATC